MVHVEAFLAAPWQYLQAVAWRVRGLRVRSRNRFSALAGRSPHAYDLWIARRERSEIRPDQPSGPQIRPIVDCRRGYEGLDRTLASIVAANPCVKPVLIGGDSIAGTVQIREPKELRSVLQGPRPWILPINPGDLVSRCALTSYAAAASQSDSFLIYADDDLICGDKRSSPHFKPGWNPELFDHHDFVSGSAAIRLDLEADEIFAGADWVSDLVHLAKNKAVPVHLGEILHHRASRPLPIIPAKPLQADLTSMPPVTAIVPTRNGLKWLRECLEGLEQTASGSLEIIVVDNGSDDTATIAFLESMKANGVRVLPIPGPFNYSALNNAAVIQAAGDLLCFLNNDVEILDSDWLAVLAHHALKPDIGAVGARLLYPDGSVQHAGVFTGIGGGAGHAHRFQNADEPGYFSRAQLPQRVSAVTAACMVVEKRKFLSVGGFDEVRFPVAFNDVDLCLKLNSRGWQSFYEPRATLIHHESKTRGPDRSKEKRARFAGELEALKQAWGTDLVRDPYHSPHLSPFCEEFLVAL